VPVFTIQTLVDRAAAIADMHDEFVKPSEWLSWYNTERRALQLFLARHGASSQNLQFTSSTGTDLIAVTGEILAVVGVWELVVGRPMRQLKVVNFADNFFQFDSSFIGAGQVKGRSQIVSIEDNNTSSTSTTNFRLYPQDLTGSYIIVTSQAPQTATAMSDSTSLPMGLEELIVLKMAKRALIKEESDIANVKELIREQESIVEEYAWSRSLAQSPSVRNVDALQRGWSIDGVGLPHPDAWTWI
jgi:hypothetical protein